MLEFCFSFWVNALIGAVDQHLSLIRSIFLFWNWYISCLPSWDWTFHLKFTLWLCIKYQCFWLASHERVKSKQKVSALPLHSLDASSWLSSTIEFSIKIRNICMIELPYYLACIFACLFLWSLSTLPCKNLCSHSASKQEANKGMRVLVKKPT